MRMTQVFLLVQALALMVLGLAYFIQPHEMTNISGMLLMAPAAITDVRAYYGGLQLGLAAYLLLALARFDLLRPALSLLVLLYATLALARMAGLWLDGGARRTCPLYAMLFEIVSAGLAFWCLRGLGR